METISSCACNEIGDFAVIGMGAHDGLDDRVFATIKRDVRHGGDQWWLDAGTCAKCRQHWMVAQEERIHDNYCLKRITESEFRGIVDQNDWPDDFLRFEDVLRAERDAGQIASFLSVKDSPLVETVKELQSARPSISVDDIAYVLAISRSTAAKLMKA